MTPRIIVHLLSGGMDSVVMLYDLQSQGFKLHCVLFDYGQMHAQELVWARHHCSRLRVLYTTVTLPQLLGSSLTRTGTGIIVPNRNAIFISHAVNIAIEAKADTITYACNADDAEVFPDCRRSFVDAMNQVIRAAGYEVELCTPYIGKPKWFIGALGQELGVNFNETWSCYTGGLTPCGHCLACKKREAALNDSHA